jgi:hypothetical protein
MRAMNIDGIEEHFKRLGLRRAFRAYREPGSGTVLLKTRRPARIVDGRLQGSEIDLYDAQTFRVWTPKKRKAKALSERYGLRVRLLDGEAELFVPAALADQLLPAFGAWTGRELDPEQLEAARARMRQARNALRLRKDPDKNEVPAAQGSGTGS